jgi:hypothetical protein
MKELLQLVLTVSEVCNQLVGRFDEGPKVGQTFEVAIAQVRLNLYDLNQ